MRDHTYCLNCGGSFGVHDPDNDDSCHSWHPSTMPWDCAECGITVTGYRPGVCRDDGTPWLICGPCFNRYQASFLPPETDRWGDDQARSQCGYCGRETTVRVEPFGQKEACKPCWEQVCYGESPA